MSCFYRLHSIALHVGLSSFNSALSFYPNVKPAAWHAGTRSGRMALSYSPPMSMLPGKLSQKPCVVSANVACMLLPNSKLVSNRSMSAGAIKLSWSGAKSTAAGAASFSPSVTLFGLVGSCVKASEDEPTCSSLLSASGCRTGSGCRAP